MTPSLILIVIGLLTTFTIILGSVYAIPQQSYSTYNNNNLFRRGSSQPVFAAHPTQIPFNQNQQRRQFQQLQYQQQPLQQQTRQQQYQEQFTPQQQAQPSFKASGGGLNPPKDVIPILSYSNDITHDGTYSYKYETGDGMSRQESGVMMNTGTKDEAPAVRGSYSYTSPDGTLIEVNYIADENGFRAEGAHLPTPPPVPEAILRSLEFIAASQRNAPQQSQQREYEQQQQQRYQRKSTFSKKK